MRPGVVIPPPESPLSEIILWLFMVCAYGHGLSRRGRNSCLVTFSKGVVTLWVVDWEGGVTLEMETPGDGDTRSPSPSPTHSTVKLHLTLPAPRVLCGLESCLFPLLQDQAHDGPPMMGMSDMSLQSGGRKDLASQSWVHCLAQLLISARSQMGIRSCQIFQFPKGSQKSS